MIQDKFCFEGPGHVVGQGCFQTVIFDHKSFNLMINHDIVDEHNDVRKYRKMKINLIIEYDDQIYSVDSLI